MERTISPSRAEPRSIRSPRHPQINLELDTDELNIDLLERRTDVAHRPLAGFDAACARSSAAACGCWPVRPTSRGTAARVQWGVWQTHAAGLPPRIAQSLAAAGTRRSVADRAGQASLASALRGPSREFTSPSFLRVSRKLNLKRRDQRTGNTKILLKVPPLRQSGHAQQPLAHRHDLSSQKRQGAARLCALADVPIRLCRSSWSCSRTLPAQPDDSPAPGCGG